MIACPYCKSAMHQVKAGRHGHGQRYKCMICRRRYMPPPEARASDNVAAGTESIIRQDTAPPAADRQSVVSPEAPSLPGKRKPNISNVAARAGVSVATVSNFINEKGRMSEATRARIRQAMEELHFTPSALMRAIHRRRTHILGVMMFDLSILDQNVGTAIAPQLLAGINAAAFEASHNILLFTGLPYQSSQPLGSEFLDGHIDGLIWVSRERHEPTLERVTSAGLPTVGLLTRHLADTAGYVDADNEGGARALVAHLAALGHRRIAYAGGVHSANLLDRRDGYRRGLADAGLRHDPRLEVSHPSQKPPPEAYAQALNAWLALPEPPTAIMVQNDRIAAVVLAAIQERGLRIPADLSVTGFDDVPDARWLGGGLTTVRQPFSQMGRLAAQSLIRLIEGAPASECRHVVPVELIVRSSTQAAIG